MARQIVPTHVKAEPGSDRQETSAAKRFGIRTFVYERQRPFILSRLEKVVRQHFNRSGGEASGDEGARGPSPLSAVVRSKGYVWLETSHTCAWYWSHAMEQFEVKEEGDWWAAIPDTDWPEEEGQRQALLADFKGAFGDRRQELVFIGIDMDEAAITAILDEALATDAELTAYTEKAPKDPPHAFLEGMHLD